MIVETPHANGPVAATALKVDGLFSGYGRTNILRDVSLTVPAGSVAALIGPNGAGKSTLMKTIAGLLRPSRGTVSLNGEDITNLTPSRRHARGLCNIPEGRGVFRSLTVRENLVLQANKGEEDKAIELASSAFPILGTRLRAQAGTLSGGEQQMLAMAQAYVKRPRLVLVDEASLGLAPLVVDVIFDFLHKLTTAGGALLIVDQFVTRALEMADTAFVLRRGELAYTGTPDELLAGNVFERYLGLE